MSLYHSADFLVVISFLWPVVKKESFQGKSNRAAYTVGETDPTLFLVQMEKVVLTVQRDKWLGHETNIAKQSAVGETTGGDMKGHRNNTSCYDETLLN